MNKLFTKIASLTLGLALVASAGAFLGGRAVKSASASEALAYTLDGTITGGTSGYATDSDITQGEIPWKVCGNTTMNPWRIGSGKNTAAATRYAKSNAPVSSEDITKVVLTLGGTFEPTSLKLLVGTSYGDNSINELSDSFATSITFERPSGKDWSGRYFSFIFDMPANTTSSSKFFTFIKAEFFYESAVARGELSIGGLTSNLLFKDDSDSLNAVWDPLDSGATLDTHEFSSDNTDVLTFSGDTYTAVAPGKAKITLTGTDSNLEEYSASVNVYVSNVYSFEVGDNVALFSSGALMELSGINTSGSTHYGTGVEYTTDPNGVYLLNVEQGTANGSLSFKNGDDYLSWSSGNSLSLSTTKNENSSWYVISYDAYSLIFNVTDSSREIWWNSGNPRFACYTGKTTESSGYNAVDLMKIEEAPVRGTISIANEFGSTMRQNATDSLSYNWTPAEASEATIVSHTWSSTNSDAIAISGDTYTAVGPGKAQISLAATDSNGQEYSVSTKEIEVIEVVSGSYVQYTSISDGDEVALVCKTAETQLSLVSSNIGKYVFYSSNPTGVYNLTLESSGDYYLLKNSEDKYLTWGDDGKADIKMADEAVDKSYWTISFDEEHNAIISNKVADGEVHRYLAWNNGSPRFAAYKTGQTAVQLYGPELELSANAIDFINNLNSLTCDDSGDTAPDVDAWKDLKDQYESVANPLSSQDKATISTIKAVEHASPVTVKEQTEAAMAKYDYIVAKYNLGQHLSEEYPDFIGRDPDPLRNITEPIVISNNTNSAIIAVTVIALTSVSAIAVLLVIKRRKTY